MLPPKLGPAQSTLLAYVVTTFIFSTIWTHLHPSFLAFAAEEPAVADVELTQPIFDTPLDAVERLQDVSSGSEEQEGYAPEFGYFDRSLLGRQVSQEPPVEELKNNVGKGMNINAGITAYFVFKRAQARLVRSDDGPLEALEARGTDIVADETVEDDDRMVDDNGVDNGTNVLSKRQAGNRIWITASTCRQPLNNGTETSGNHPQLVMYASTQNRKPGPDSTDNLVTPPSGILFDNGFATFNFTANADVYIGISAPNLEQGWFGSWNFEIGASMNGPYHSYNGTNPFLFMVDTDSESALFITYDLSEPNTTEADKWKNNNPFRMYAYPADEKSPVKGMEHSLCALKNLDNSTNFNASMSITTKFGGGLPRSQFHIIGLDNGQTYHGFLTVEGGPDVLQLPGGAGTVRGGGKVFQQFEWTTKEGNTF